MADELTLALDLDRALAGGEAPIEALELAALLHAAAASARMEVTQDELERALGGARPTRRQRRRLVPALGLVAAVAVAGVIAFLVRTPGTEVQARAARALDATFFVVEQVRPRQPKLFPPTDVTGYFDGRTGRAHLRITDLTGRPSAETVLLPDGSVERWLAASNTTILAPSCDALPGGCAEALDPLDLYMRTLQHAQVRRLDGAYELTIHTARVDQVVEIDERTYLPRRIEWRQDGKLVSMTRFVTLERQDTPPRADAWPMPGHLGARVVQLTPDGRRVRVESVHAAPIHAGLRWLGPSYEGHPARVADVTLTGGTATRITYGPLTLWNYRDVIPPAVLQARGVVAKVIAIPGGIVHASFGEGGGVVADATFADGNVAALSSGGNKIDTLRAVQRLERAP